MSRRHFVLGLAGLGLVILFFMRQTGVGQQPEAKGPEEPPESPLPIKQVVLFNSGLGYFQREGNVEGSSRINLTFPVSEINDLLKSLVLQDLGGGRISSVNYDSHDPLEKVLRSFGLNLNDNPTFGQILQQARGEKIEVALLDTDKKPAKLTGTIVGLEVQRQQAGKDGGFVDLEFLNISGPSGLQSLAMAQITGVRFLNPTLEKDFQRALQVLATSHDAQKKTVSVGFTGAGRREVRVGYVVERPIWKTTYRLRSEPNGKVFIQGWALVENTSDDDWNNVRMVLVSGKPISYQMNLYDPLYVPRPTVEPEIFASLRPPLYGAALDQQDPAQMPQRPGAFPGPRRIGHVPYAGMHGAVPPEGGIGGFGGGFPGGVGGFAGVGGIGGLGGGLGGFGGGLTGSFPPPGVIQNKLTYEELQRRRQEAAGQKDAAKQVGSGVAGMNFKEGIVSVATGGDIGNYYRYVLDQRISLPRQKSAMVPILDQTVEGGKLSIYDETVHAMHPLLGLRLKNTSAKLLTQGPITVYDEGSYAGDTRILDVQPNEERLLSYALDQAVEVKHQVKRFPAPDFHLSIQPGKLTALYKIREEKTYTFQNRSNQERTILVEQPIRSTWQLLEPKTPKEKTRAVYRFETNVPAGKAANLAVLEEQFRNDELGVGTSKDAPLYDLGFGITVKPVVDVEESKVTKLQIYKGSLYAKYKTRESTTYFVQNLSSQGIRFAVDHIIRKDRMRIGAPGIEQKGPDTYSFKLEVTAGKTGHHEVKEERTYWDDGQDLKNVSEAKLRQAIAMDVASAELKSALEKVRVFHVKTRDNEAELSDLESQLKIMNDDQSRLRENLRIIPPAAEPYKTFLEKFVTQETAIEGLRRQVRQVQTRMRNHRKEYEAFVTGLNVD